MSPAMVTLGYEPVEWISPYEDLKDAIWTDEEFSAWMSDLDPLAALETVSAFRRVVTNQLRKRGVTSHEQSEWAGRTIALVIQLHKRRQELRAIVREANGTEFVAAWVRDFDSRHPRYEVQS